MHGTAFVGSRPDDEAARGLCEVPRREGKRNDLLQNSIDVELELRFGGVSHSVQNHTDDAGLGLPDIGMMGALCNVRGYVPK